MRGETGRLRRWPIVALVVLATVGTGVALAVTTQADSPGMGALKVKTETSLYSTSSTAYTTITNGSISNIVVPANGYIRARFSAESDCAQQEVGTPNAADICSIRISTTAAGQLNPKSGMDFAFDTLDEGNLCCGTTHYGDGREAHSMERVSDPLPAGTYTVIVQAAVFNPNMVFRLDDWTLSVEVLNPTPAS